MNRSTVVVTGAANGIGAATAVRLASSHDVALIDLDQDGLDVVAAKLKSAGGRCSTWRRDVVADDPNVILQEVADELGEPVALVNNAGVIVLGPAMETTPAQWRKVLDVNLTATFFWCQAAARRMQAQGGAIVNVASQLASLGGVNRISYAASKAGVVQLTRGLATEWAPHAIRVNAVAPGPVRTAMTEARLAVPQTARPLVERIPMGRVAEPREVADAIDFLLSPSSAYITGAVLPVDGGYTAA